MRLLVLLLLLRHRCRIGLRHYQLCVSLQRPFAAFPGEHWCPIRFHLHLAELHACITLHLHLALCACIRVGLHAQLQRVLVLLAVLLVLLDECVQLLLAILFLLQLLRVMLLMRGECVALAALRCVARVRTVHASVVEVAQMLWVLAVQRLLECSRARAEHQLARTVRFRLIADADKVLGDHHHLHELLEARL